MSNDEPNELVYSVVVNHEAQYSIWPQGRPLPAGWTEAGKRGARSECLDHIETVWTDMRPLSLRKQMADQADGSVSLQQETTEQPECDEGQTRSAPAVDSLVQRLSEGMHPVTIDGAQASPDELRQRIQRGYVHIMFTDTRGGTQLGVRVDHDGTDLTQADFEEATGTLGIVGRANLNDVDVLCKIDIDLATLEGTGRLVIDD